MRVDLAAGRCRIPRPAARQQNRICERFARRRATIIGDDQSGRLHAFQPGEARPRGAPGGLAIFVVSPVRRGRALSRRVEGRRRRTARDGRAAPRPHTQRLEGGAIQRRPYAWLRLPTSFWVKMGCSAGSYSPDAQLRRLVGRRGNMAVDEIPEGVRECPFCAELIRSKAKICRFCQRDLPAEPSEDSSAAGGSDAVEPRPLRYGDRVSSLIMGDGMVVDASLDWDTVLVAFDRDQIQRAVAMSELRLIPRSSPPMPPVPPQQPR